MCSSPCHAASMRSSARRSVAASTWLRARRPTQCGPSGRRPGPALRPAKPSGTSRAPRTTTNSGRTASRRSSPPQNPGPAAGVGQRAPRPRRRTASLWRDAAHACAAKTRGGSLGLRAYSMTPGATRLVVRKGCLYYPNYLGFLATKPAKTAYGHQRCHRFVTAPFLVQKAPKTVNSKKCVFSC